MAGPNFACNYEFLVSYDSLSNLPGSKSDYSLLLFLIIKLNSEKFTGGNETKTYKAFYRVPRLKTAD